MMPMPPTSSEIAAIDPSTMLKMRLVCSAWQELERDDDLVIVLVVESTEEGSDLRVGGFHGRQILHLDGDLVELNLLGLETAGGSADERLAESRARDAERDVDIVVERLSLHGASLAALLGLAALLQDADDPVVKGVDLHRVLHRVQVREETTRQAGRDDADILGVLFVQMREKTAADDPRPGHIHVRRQRADHLARDFVAIEAHILADDAHGQDAVDARDGGLEPGAILIGEAIGQLHAARAAASLLAGLVGRLETAQQDVVAAKILDGLLGFVRGPFPDRKHGDDRADAENDAKHRQGRAQFVEHQALDAQAHGAYELEGEYAGPEG